MKCPYALSIDYYGKAIESWMEMQELEGRAPVVLLPCHEEHDTNDDQDDMEIVIIPSSRLTTIEQIQQGLSLEGKISSMDVSEGLDANDEKLCDDFVPETADERSFVVRSVGAIECQSKEFRPFLN